MDYEFSDSNDSNDFPDSNDQGAATPLPVLRWQADLARPAPARLQAFRGETVRLECILSLRGAPADIPQGATASLVWQSPGMGSSWYVAPAEIDPARSVVAADFGPSNDAGADRYLAFLRVDCAGVCYRALATLEMLASPGETPNEIPIPPKVLDFAMVEVLNAPYYTQAQADAAFVPTSRTVNTKPLSADVTLTGSDIKTSTAEGALSIASDVTNLTNDVIGIGQALGGLGSRLTGVENYCNAHRSEEWVFEVADGNDQVSTVTKNVTINTGV